MCSLSWWARWWTSAQLHKIPLFCAPQFWRLLYSFCIWIRNDVTSTSFTLYVRWLESKGMQSHMPFNANTSFATVTLHRHRWHLSPSMRKLGWFYDVLYSFTLHFIVCDILVPIAGHSNRLQRIGVHQQRGNSTRHRSIVAKLVEGPWSSSTFLGYDAIICEFYVWLFIRCRCPFTSGECQQTKIMKWQSK